MILRCFQYVFLCCNKFSLMLQHVSFDVATRDILPNSGVVSHPDPVTNGTCSPNREILTQHVVLFPFPLRLRRTWMRGASVLGQDADARWGWRTSAHVGVGCASFGHVRRTGWASESPHTSGWGCASFGHVRGTGRVSKSPHTSGRGYAYLQVC